MDSSNDICRREFWTTENVGWYERLMEDMRRDFEENAVGVFTAGFGDGVSDLTSDKIKLDKNDADDRETI